MNTHILHLVILLLAAAVFVVVVFRWINLPSIIGYLMVGVFVAPHIFRTGETAQSMQHLAEFGVVFLMFSIGLEFSLSRLYSMKRLVFGLGLGQVCLVILLVWALTMLAGLPWYAGVALGGALSMSSTAVLSKLLAERIELDSSHGREVMGVLLFQDIAVVPLLILIPALSQRTENLFGILAFEVLKAAIVLGVVVFFGQRLMRGWFFIVAKTKSTELFVLNVLLITLGLAWVTEFAGLSLALGAFLAGMLISETDYRYQVEEDIKPFRDVLLGLFFITIGSRLDILQVWQNLFWVLGFVVALLVGKLALTMALSRLSGATPGTAMRTGLWLCAGGEFGFVLLAQIADLEIVAPHHLQIVLSGLILSLVLAPLIVQFSDRVVLRFIKSEWLLRSMQITQIAAHTLDASKHAIICGYGRTGEHLARFLEREAISIVALDNDPERVQEAATAGEPVLYGDCVRRETLIAAGLARANVLIVTFSDISSTLRILHHVSELRPELPVVVRAAAEADVERLFAAGATEVVPEALESSVMLSTHALAFLGVPLHRVVKHLRNMREQHYSLFRGLLQGDTTANVAEGEHQRVETLSLLAGAHAVGKTVAEMEGDLKDVKISAVRRRGAQRRGRVKRDDTLHAGDTILLLGGNSALAAAEQVLLNGRQE